MVLVVLLFEGYFFVSCRFFRWGDEENGPFEDVFPIGNGHIPSSQSLTCFTQNDGFQSRILLKIRRFSGELCETSGWSVDWLVDYRGLYYPVTEVQGTSSDVGRRERHRCLDR